MAVVPWDVDLTWGDQMYGNGAEPFYRAGVLQREPFKAEYEARLAEFATCFSIGTDRRADRRIQR